MKRERPTDEELFRAVRALNLELMATEGFELVRNYVEVLGDHFPESTRLAEGFLEAYAGLYRDIMEKDDAA
jgi:hypothetical protein